MLEYLSRLVAHMKWADRRLLDRLETEQDARALRLMAHIAAAEGVWITRLQGDSSSHLPIWPELAWEACSALAHEAHREFEGYLETLDAARLAETVEYTNQQGTRYRTTRSDILTHVAMHGNYHRGQIAQALRLAGKEPVNTDYITWVRQQGG